MEKKTSSKQASLTDSKPSAVQTASEMPKRTSVKAFINSPEVQKRIKDMLGKRASQFTTSVLSLVGSDPTLAESDPNTLFSATLTAASLDLPINKNLGFAHIIAYKNNNKGITEAQFQMGWRGFVQLAQRSGQYQTISATEVYDGQLIHQDPLNGNTYDWDAKKSDKVIGYVAYFKLLNGFQKDLYMTIDEVKAHGMRYSQSFKRNYGPWKDNFDAMALKTVTKMLISKYGPMSVDMQTAIEVDQAVIEGDDRIYIDNDDVNLPADVIEAIEGATDKDQLQTILNSLPVEQKKIATSLVLEKAEQLL